MPAAPSALLLLIGAAHAWEVNRNADGDPLYWPTGQVEYWVNAENGQDISPERLQFLISAAAGAWSKVPDAQLAFSYKGPTTLNAADYTDDKNIVYFEEQWPAEWDPSFLALTFTWSVDGGEIIAFDMAINEDNFDWGVSANQGDNDLMNMLTHEMGHAIGLSHSQVEAATMYYQASNGEEEKRNLTIDDEEGARFLYGGLLAAAPGCAAAGPRSGGAAGWFAAAAVLSAGALRRRRPDPAR